MGMPQVAWRLLREEGIIGARYQQVLCVVAESSACVRIECHQKAMADQRSQRSELQAAWEVVEGTVELLTPGEASTRLSLIVGGALFRTPYSGRGLGEARTGCMWAP